MFVLSDQGITGYEVTPPGQNAFIAPGGERGPHFNDQFELYQSFGRKRMWFSEDEVRQNTLSVSVLEY
jgi:penicillin amidase